MGLLDSLVAGAAGAEMVTVVNGVIAKHGGLGGMLDELRKKGLGDAVKSWVSTGPNLPVSPDQVHQALGPDTVAQIAAKLGMSPQELSSKLSVALPQVVDKLTPGGSVPPDQ